MRLCALDLDGTLVDSAGDICRHVNATLQAMGQPVREQTEIRRHIGRGAQLLMRGLLPNASDNEIHSATDDYRRRYQAAPLVECVLYPGAVELLQRLKAAGVPMALVTNKPQEIAVAMLEQLGVLPLFSSVQGAVEGRAHKPDPAGIRAAAELVGAEPSTTVMVGDSVVDLDTAVAFGCAFQGVAHGIDAGMGLRARGIRLCEGLEMVGQEVLATGGGSS